MSLSVPRDTLFPVLIIPRRGRRFTLLILALLGAGLTGVARAQSVTEFSLPEGGSAPAGIAAGPDGNLWFTEQIGRIGRITTSGTITEFPISYADPVGIASGPDGNLWFTEHSGDRISRITTTGVITQFSIASGGNPFDIAAGPDGNLWFTEQSGNRIGRITPAGVVTGEFSLPALGSYPTGITGGPDGNLWFTEQSGNRIGRITTAGVITEFSIPTRGNPFDITVGPDGNLWFTEQSGNRIGRITTGGVIAEFSIPSGGNPFGIAAGPDGNLWFTDQSGNKIGRMTTPGQPSPCVSDSTTLCLDGSRFQVRAEWQAPSGTSGPATAAPLTGNTGSFWFFDSNNIEVIVKVLNACSVNGHYWFFAGGLTNVGVRITVTDTQTGMAETYTNPVGAAFQPIQDTATFPTCL